GQDRGAGPDHRDGQPLVLVDGLLDAFQLARAEQQIARNLTRLPLCSKRGRSGQGEHGQEQCAQKQWAPSCPDRPRHASPPARSASGAFRRRDPGLRPSALLYHVITNAAPIIMRMPNTLTRSRIQKEAESSTMAKCAANERKTPRQKISSECCPQTIGGQAHHDFSIGQSRGTNHTVTTASARKCAKRSTSRLTLSIG